MYNLLIAGGCALLAYGVGAAFAGWLAGLIPALLAFGGALFYTSRRIGKQIEVIAKKAMEELQGGNMAAARATFRTALPLGKWQVLVAPQIHAQLGAIDYLEACSMLMQRQITTSKQKFTESKAELEQAQDWRARTMLACVLHRENNTDAAVATLKAVEQPGKVRFLPGASPSGEALFYAVYAYILNEAKRRDEALQVVGRGLESLPKHAGLLAVQEAMSNRKRPDFKVLGESWYQFFPEHIPQEVLIEQARAAGRLPAQQPAANRQMTWPQPRR